MIEREIGAETEVVEGEQAQFDVEVDGRLIFSKREQNRFPEEDEILAALRL